jgi:hypothetical protein
MEAEAMTLAYSFYEHKEHDKFLKEIEETKVPVKLIESTEHTKTYRIGDTWTVIYQAKPGKAVAVVLRPILKA